MLAEILNGIAESVRKNQDNKEMTRKAILLLEALGQNAADLRADFKAAYGEEA